MKPTADLSDEAHRLEASVQYLQSVLDALTAHIAILDESGVIIGLNAAWRRFARDNHMTWPGYGLGQNYLARADAATGDDAEIGQQAAAGLRAVMAGKRDYFRLEYPCHSPTQERWFVMHVTGFDSDDGVRVVIAHENISERKQAELALQQSYQDLKQHLDELATLNLIAHTLVTATDLQEALDIVVATTTRVFDATGTGISLLDDDRSDITPFAYFDRRLPASSMGGKSETGGDPANSLFRSMVFLIEDSSLYQRLFVESQPVVIPDTQVDPRLTQAHDILQAGHVCCLMLVPLLSQGGVLGVIGIATDQPGREFTPDEVMVAETIASQVAGAIETARLFEQAQQGAVAEERNRLARDLHDSVTQTLYSLDLFANAAQQALYAGRIERATEHAWQILSLSQSALADMRLLVFELRPPLLEQLGLAGALRARLESVEARAGFKTEFEAKGERPLSPLVEAELYAVAQEVLNNALKHAQAGQVSVSLECEEQGCCLTIRDDGIGFDPEIAEDGGGFGLQNMRERVERVGGILTLEAAPGRGTTVRVEVAA
jgi:signal transduction histidine kinase